MAAAPARAIYWGSTADHMMEIGRSRSGRYHQIIRSTKRLHRMLLLTRRRRQRRIPFPILHHARTILYDIVPFWQTEPTVRKVYKANIPMEKEMQFQFYQGECTSSMRYERRSESLYVPAKSTDIMPTLGREPKHGRSQFDAAPITGDAQQHHAGKTNPLWFNKVNGRLRQFQRRPKPGRENRIDPGQKDGEWAIAVLTPLGCRQHPFTRHLDGQRRRLHAAWPGR
ncbi:MAG: hypothetical protein ACLRS8_14600 [Parabacteroides merdae]